jgi:very-short-patch-repair endonuclease
MGLQLLTDRARRVRRDNAEHRLAWLLRSRRLKGLRFRRQHTIGPFVVDFICVEQALIIELVGAQHVLGLGSDNDRKRFLESLGYQVIRLWDSEVLSDPRTVLKKVIAHL